MPYSGNFTRVTLVAKDPDLEAPALKVEGTSKQAEDARAISVALPHGGVWLMAPADDPAASEEWSATFVQGKPAFAVGDEVIVIGIAMLKSTSQPFVWSKQLPITAEGAPP
jgi:hypothetical protein